MPLTLQLIMNTKTPVPVSVAVLADISWRSPGKCIILIIYVFFGKSFSKRVYIILETKALVLVHLLPHEALHLAKCGLVDRASKEMQSVLLSSKK